jgi:sulfite exporter TauE/SafE
MDFLSSLINLEWVKKRRCCIMLGRTNETSDIEGISYQTLSGLSYWAGFVGIWTIVGAILGIIGSIVGMVANPFSIFGVISALIALIMGLKLRSSKKEFDSFVHSKASVNLEIALDSLRHYFRIQGILIILALVFVVITIVAMAAMGSLMVNY